MLNAFGAKVRNTYQLDVSGGSEGMNTLYTDRRFEKRQIKTESIKRVLPYLRDEDIASGTTDYLDFLGNERTGYFWIYGNYFVDTPFKIDVTIKTTDGPNAAGTLVNVIRATKMLPIINCLFFKIITLNSLLTEILMNWELLEEISFIYSVRGKLIIYSNFTNIRSFKTKAILPYTFRKSEKTYFQFFKEF